MMDLQIPTITSLDPKVWGRSTWEFLDTIVVTYPLNDPAQNHRDAVINMLEALRILLPCPECRAHYNTFLDAHPMGDIISTRLTLLTFYFELRKDIAMRTRRPFRIRNVQELWDHLITTFHLVSSDKTQRIRPRPLTQQTPQQMPQKPSQSRPFVRRGCNCSK
jgi:hypothetical protein